MYFCMIMLKSFNNGPSLLYRKSYRNCKNNKKNTICVFFKSCLITNVFLHINSLHISDSSTLSHNMSLFISPQSSLAIKDDKHTMCWDASWSYSWAEHHSSPLPKHLSNALSLPSRELENEQSGVRVKQEQDRNRNTEKKKAVEVRSQQKRKVITIVLANSCKRLWVSWKAQVSWCIIIIIIIESSKARLAKRHKKIEKHKEEKTGNANYNLSSLQNHMNRRIQNRTKPFSAVFTFSRVLQISIRQYLLMQS